MPAAASQREPRARSQAGAARSRLDKTPDTRQRQATSGWPQAAQSPELAGWLAAAQSSDHRAPSSLAPEAALKRYNLNNNSHHHNHHYYDCCNGSELAAAWLPAAPQAAADNALNSASATCRNHNYDQNILLFATEHNNQQAKASHVDKLGAESRRATPAAGIPGQPRSWQQQQQLHQHQHRRPLSSAAGATATGRFISHYPSWRQSHSPTAPHYQNYSFHVPLHQLAGSHGYGHGARRGDTLPESRVRAHSSNRDSAHSRLGQTGRSRTVEHLQQLSGSASFPLAPVASVADDNYNRAYEHFGQSPPEGPAAAARAAAAARRQLVLSEHNLPHITRHTATRPPPDAGSDNPFKPGTELSWDADLMVRLMQRGYPVHQLPALVQSAKHVAGRRGKSSDNLSASLLAPDRQAWAGGLTRAKSLGRCNVGANSASRDSIDRLIARIEQLVAGEPERDAAAPERQSETQRPTTNNKRPLTATTRQQPPSSSSPAAQPNPTTTFTSATKPTDTPNNNNKHSPSKSHKHRVKTKEIDCCVVS